jgi:glycosyltransferase involved in cell wall biosynthesis
LANQRITYFGILRSITSWAKVSREMISSLLSLGEDINIYERKGFLFDSRFPLNYNIKTRITNRFKGDVVFTFENPRVYGYLPRQSFKIGFLVYEFTVLPEFWVERINKCLDWVVVPSRFCRKVFIDSGVDSNKIKVLRYGFNPTYYYPREKSRPGSSIFNFLCVANPHKREGLDLLLESFAKAFGKKDKVRLILKLTYMPAGKIKPFEYAGLAGLFKPYSGRLNVAPMQIIHSRLSEIKMGGLYRSSNCYISLAKAEAFGLCFLEALACGLPVAGVKYSGQTDFLSPKNAHFIRHDLVKAGEEVYEKIGEAGVVASPDANHAADIMREIYLGRAKDGQYGLFPNPAYFWWPTIAAEFSDWLRSI